MFFSSLVFVLILSFSFVQGQEAKKNESTIGILKNQSIRPCEGSRANDSNCAVHVFRVVLSSKPSDNSTEPLNRDKIIFANARKNKELSREVAQKIPQDVSEPMRKSMKTLIENEGFYLREMGHEPPNSYMKTDERLMSHSPSSPSPPLPSMDIPLSESVVMTDKRLIPFLSSSFSPWWILILAIGVILGVFSTVVCILLLEYRNKPVIDRSSQMSFRKCSASSNVVIGVNGDGERLRPLLIPNYYTPEYRAPPPPLVARSISTTTASNSHVNYVNAFSPLDSNTLTMAYAPPPPHRGREGRDARREMRNHHNSYEMQLYTNVTDGNEGRGRSSSASIR